MVAKIYHAERRKDPLKRTRDIKLQNLRKREYFRTQEGKKKRSEYNKRNYKKHRMKLLNLVKIRLGQNRLFDLYAKLNLERS